MLITQEPKCVSRKSISTWACRDVNELYENISKVGAGTYGEVNKARLKSDPEKIVALKKIKDESETEGFPITALREINILQQCDHPNIIKLHDIVVSKASDSDKKKRGCTYLVFEYMEHELLGLVETCSLTSPQVKCILKQMLLGLEYLHSKNIIHRDIKSANILINNQGEVKIADFGLAKKINPFTGKLTQRVVTRWYRAPELLLGSRKYTTQIDIWALGCVFAELLIGKSHALFPAQKTPDQFEVICEKCGTPDETMWPDFKSLPFFANMIPKKNYPKSLMKYMRKQKSNVDHLALDLLDKMLTLNPDSRINARDALQHEYFTSDPLPCEISEMPKIEKDCHAYVLNAEKRASAMNAAGGNQNQNQKKGGPVQNKSYSQNKSYQNNPNQNQPPNRPPQNYNSSYNNNNSYSSRYNNNNNRNSSTAHSDNRRNDNNSSYGHSKPFHSSSDQKINPEKTSQQSSKDNIPVKNDTVSKSAVNYSQSSTKEKKPETQKGKEQSSQSVFLEEKIKRTDIAPNIYPKVHESMNHKRPGSHDIDDFELITKKRLTDPIEQNN